MLSLRGRQKKLIVAFHFHFSQQAAWKCDACRKQGLERKRRCGFLTHEGKNPFPVWARHGVVTLSCPKSYIKAESLSFLETFYAVRRFGVGNILRMPAKLVDALVVLEAELAKERTHAEK